MTPLFVVLFVFTEQVPELRRNTCADGAPAFAVRRTRRRGLPGIAPHRRVSKLLNSRTLEG